MNDTDRVVTPVLDEGMLAIEPLNFHPLRNDRTTAVSAADLLKFVRAVSGEPVIAKLPLRD
jgi:Ala-tRNA(Pro) deacylase